MRRSSCNPQGSPTTFKSGHIYSHGPGGCQRTGRSTAVAVAAASAHHQKLYKIAGYALEIICQSRFANTSNKRAPLTYVNRVVVERGRQGHRCRGWHAGLTALKCVTDCLTQAMTRKSQGS